MSNYKKEIFTHSQFYISKFTKNHELPYLLFIHGGPGYNCGIMEYLIEHYRIFEKLNYNIVFYDQRNCGRSNYFPMGITHSDNINDLDLIYKYLIEDSTLSVKGFIGHSYGAKLLFDFYKKFKSDIPGIFVSTTNSILIPRLNNLIFDLAYLKKIDTEKYNNILTNMQDLNFQKIWSMTEELSELFKKNKDRRLLYWANLDYFKKVCEIEMKLNLPVNTNTFMHVRKDLYSDESNFSVDINSLETPYLWINGFHDLIMNGAQGN